ncbi:MAG: PD40 domain-containing protein, partial [Candidatus Marinimicrobia bacterium]|nr:PD40 domain-containing protein [Candidatus Neomarinimicrobiota bacterium]
MKRLITTIILATAILVGSITPLYAQSPDKLFQKGLIKEEGEGALNKAINISNKIVENRNADKSLQAKALLHIGLCYEKLGRDEATKAYQRLVNNFPGQKNEVAIARERLSQLILIAEKIPKGIVIKQVWTGPDVDNSGSVSFDGEYLSFVNWDTGDLAVRNLNTKQNKSLVSGSWDAPMQYAYYNVISPNGKQIAYSWYNDNASDLYLINIDNPLPRLLYRKEGVEVYPVSWLSDKEIIINIKKKGADSQFGSYNILDGTIEILETFKPRNWGLTSSPDENYIAYHFKNESQNGTFDINILSMDGKGEIALVEHPANDRVMGWMPERNEFLFNSDRSGTWDLWALTVDNGKPIGQERRLYTDIGEVEPMGITKNGECYFGFSRRNFTTYITPFDIKTGELQEQEGKSTIGSNFQAKWSPDGQYLAYIKEDGKAASPWQLTIQDLNTHTERALGNSLNLALDPRWSPDGKSIIVIGRDKNQVGMNNWSGIFQIDVKTGNTKEILLLSDYKYNKPDDAASP